MSLDDVILAGERDLSWVSAIAKAVAFVYPPALIIAEAAGIGAEALDVAEKVRVLVESHRAGNATPAMANAVLQAIAAQQAQTTAGQSVS